MRLNGAGMSGPLRGALEAAAALALFFLLDKAIFNPGTYGKVLEPNSSAGLAETHLAALDQPAPGAGPEVLVVGDSRIAEGFSSRLAGAASGGRLRFRNFGLGGTTPRVWSWLIREADPDRRRFRAVAIALDDYSDADWFFNLEDNVADERFIAMRLGPAACADFSMSMETWESRLQALFGCLFRGSTLRNDFQAFLLDPAKRIRTADDWRLHGEGYLADYDGRAGSLAGMTVDWNARTIQFPPGIAPEVQDNVRKFVTKERVAQKGLVGRYRREWLGRIVDYYRGSETKIVFLQLPRGPLPDPSQADPRPRFLDSVSGNPGVAVLPAETFVDLERPDVFFDGLHLNSEGRRIFSRRLAEQTERALTGERN